MFDIGLPELVVILLIVLLVVGPEDVPRILYRLGRFVRYVSGHWHSMRNTIGDVMHEAEMNEYRIKATEQKDAVQKELLSDFEVERLSDESVLPLQKKAKARKKLSKQPKKVSKDAQRQEK